MERLPDHDGVPAATVSNPGFRKLAVSHHSDSELSASFQVIGRIGCPGATIRQKSTPIHRILCQIPGFVQIHRLRMQCNLCTETMKPKIRSAESSAVPAALQSLIPAGAVASETQLKISAQFLQERFEAANGMKTENPVLSAAEQCRFQENSRMIEAATLGIEFRNYLLWEVHSTGQFRETDQDFLAYGARVAKLKPAQLRRAVHSGRIRMAMIHVGLDDVGPTGRQVEYLSKVEDDHTVQAWRYALEYMRIHGRSDALADEALMEYCRIKKISYGRRMPNGSRKSALQQALRPRPKDAASVSLECKEPQKGIWKLSAAEEQVLLGIVGDSDGPASTVDTHQRLSNTMESLNKVASMKTLSDYDARQFEELLALVMRKDSETGRSLENRPVHAQPMDNSRIF